MECYLVELKKKEKVRFPSGISTFWTGNDTSTPNLYLQGPQSSWGQGVKPYSESGVGRGLLGSELVISHLKDSDDREGKKKREREKKRNK